MENTPSNKIQALTKSIRGSYTQIKFSKTIEFFVAELLFVIVPFSTSHSICHKIGFWQGSIVWKCWSFNSNSYSQLKNSTQDFLKKIYFKENLFQSYSVEIMFKISSDCHIKICRGAVQ